LATVGERYMILIGFSDIAGSLSFVTRHPAIAGHPTSGFALGRPPSPPGARRSGEVNGSPRAAAGPRDLPPASPRTGPASSDEGCFTSARRLAEAIHLPRPLGRDQPVADVLGHEGRIA